MDPSRYAELFRTESREQLASINRALLVLEQGEESREPVDSIFRAVHTIKGMSATMGYTAVAEFSHELESLLDKVRGGERSITPDLMDALFAATDALEDGVERAREDLSMSDDMRRALERLHDIAGGRSTAEFRVVRPSSVVPLPIQVAEANAPSPMEGPGVVVEIAQSPDVMLPGVRAFMIVQRLRGLGELVASEPTVEKLQSATTPQEFVLLLDTTAGETEIETAVRSVGDIAGVRVWRREPESGSVAPDSEVPGTDAVRGAEFTPASGVTPESGIAVGPSVTPASGFLSAAADRERPAVVRAKHVRIELSRLDALLNLIGELVIVRGRLQSLTSPVPDPELQVTMDEATRLIGELQTEIMTSRLVPVGQVFDRFPRLVRDVARQLGKDVLFAIEGKEIELDRSVLDEIGEPVVHLLRNSVDHGLETPAVREELGKPRAGRLTLSAHRERTAVVIVVRDDGRGIDRAGVLERAIELGMIEAGTVRLDDDTLLRCIAHPGFSTARKITGVSGRGVGIDAVQARVRSLGGSLEIETASGKGTSVVIRLPVTLAIVRALLARVGGERYALPLTHVRETMERGPAQIRRMQGREMLMLRNEVLPILNLRDVVGISGERVVGEEEIVVIERGDRRAGLIVDELTGQEDIVVKSFDAVREGESMFSGATILSDGAPALILDVGSLL